MKLFNKKLTITDSYNLRSDSGARVFFRMRGADIEILGIASKKNENKVINAVKQEYLS